MRLTRDNSEHIWTYEFGEPYKPTVVIIHGYGGSGMIFYKMFKQLSEHFHVYLIDLLGMGRSSRPEFICTTHEECELFFVKSLEKWRKRMRLDVLNVIGHSFGGYILSKYALHYPDNLQKVIYLSPFSSERAPEEPDEYFEEKMEEHGWFKSVLFKVVTSLWSKHMTPYRSVRFGGRIFGGYVMKHVLKDKFKTLPEDEFD